MGKSPDSSERHATRFTILVSPTFLFCSLFPKKPFLHQPSSAMVTSCLYLYFTSLLHLPTSRHPSRAQSKAISPRTPRTVPRTPRLPRYSTYSPPLFFSSLYTVCRPVLRRLHRLSAGKPTSTPRAGLSSRAPDLLKVSPGCFPSPSHSTKARLILSCPPSWVPGLSKGSATLQSPGHTPGHQFSMLSLHPTKFIQSPSQVLPS